MRLALVSSSSSYRYGFRGRRQTSDPLGELEHSHVALLEHADLPCKPYVAINADATTAVHNLLIPSMFDDLSPSRPILVRI